MTYTPQHVANFFLEKAELEASPMTQMKLIKLVYIAYGWYLAITGERLFLEPIEAWRHGPVVASIYHEFKDYGSNPIARRAMELDLDTWEPVRPQVPSSNSATRLILDRVWTVYKQFSGWQLRAKTHEKGSPWDKVYVEGTNELLVDEEIKAHYDARIRSYLAEARTGSAGT